MAITNSFRDCFQRDVFFEALDEVQDTFLDNLDTVAAAKAAFEAALDQVQVVDIGGGPVNISFNEALDQLDGALDALVQEGVNQGAEAANDFRRNAGVEDGGNFERRLGANGIHILDGVGLIVDGVNLVAPRDAYITLGGRVSEQYADWRTCLLSADGTVFATMYADVPRDVETLDGCGNPTNISVTNRVYGQKNQSAAAFAAQYGIAITSVFVSVYWIGEVNNAFSVFTLLRNVGLADEQIAAAIAEAGIPDNDGNLPEVTSFPGNNPSLRTSVIIDTGLMTGLDSFFEEAGIRELMTRDLPLGLKGLTGDGPFGDEWFDQLDDALGGPSVIVNGVRPQPGQAPEVDTTESPLLTPTAVALGIVDLQATLAFVNDPEGNECWSLADELGVTEAVSFVLGIFETILGGVQSAAQAMAGGVSSVILKLNTKIQETVEMLGYSSVIISSALCFLGAGSLSLGGGFADGFITAITEAVGMVIETITAPLDALNALLAALNIPVCFSFAVLKDILGTAAGCIPAKFEIPEELLNCLQAELDKITKMLTSVTGMIDAITSEVKGLLAFVKHVLGSLTLGFAGEKATCFSPASATTLAAMSVAFR